MKTQLTVEVDYDPDRTDPEGLASAMDRLLETALSTPGIMDEYGSPRIGEFFPAGGAEGPAPTTPTVVVEIRGGVLQEAYASHPAMRLVLLDYDTEGCNPAEDANLFEITDQKGSRRVVHATEYPTTPLAGLTGTDSGKVLDQAGIDYQPDVGPETETIRRWVIFDPDAGTLITTRVYSNYDEAAEEAAQLHDVLVLPLVWQNIRA